MTPPKIVPLAFVSRGSMVTRIAGNRSLIVIGAGLDAVNESFRCLGQAHSPPREEGWLRHQGNFGEAHLSTADGVVAHTETFLVNDHPGRSSEEASRHFLSVASTPPHEGGICLFHEFVPWFKGSQRRLLQKRIVSPFMAN